jgi:hypothetical protein
MTLYILDTDIAGFAFQRHPTVLQRLQRLPEDDLVVTTIITFGEDLGGWLPACRRALGCCHHLRSVLVSSARGRWHVGGQLRSAPAAL